MRPMLTIALASLALSSCATNDYANGPIKMDGRTLACYIKYRSLPAPEYFAVAINGSGCGYTYCPDGGGCSGNRLGMALDACRAYAKTEKCVIYAYGGKPVFGGDDMPSIAAGKPKAQEMPPAAPAASSTVTMPVETQRNAESRLREIQRLRDQSLITQQEYDERRRAILGSL
ncbi:SHOCT domain-containing protein [Azospirillum palustre]